jgi:two-component system chemotaxis response regulator CheB
MDIEMPGTDGYAATERIMTLCPTPILILTSRAERDQARTAFEAIRRGAIEVVPKPVDTAGWDGMALSLPAIIHSVVGARLGAAPDGRTSDSVYRGTRLAPAERVARAEDPGAAWPSPSAALRYIAVGASTGGPSAIRELGAGLPAGIPASVIVVQHIASGFETAFAEWLASELRRDVRLATDGERPAAGTIRIAPGGSHLVLGDDGRLHLDTTPPPRRGHRPSADDLFYSCARSFPLETAGVLLTGMGSDGAEGLAELRRRGGVTVAQDEQSSVVFGMPAAALQSGAAQTAMTPGAIGAALGGFFLGARR